MLLILIVIVNKIILQNNKKSFEILEIMNINRS